MLSRDAEGMKQGGQELLGGIDVKSARNGWGSQVRGRFGFYQSSALLISDIRWNLSKRHSLLKDYAMLIHPSTVFSFGPL